MYKARNSMSHHDGYERENHENQYYRLDQRSYKPRKESMFGEILGELPIVGELFESISGGKIGKKGIKKLGCCCAPIALILLIPAIMLVYWIIRSGLSLFKIDISNINWLEQTKNWLMGNFGLDQIGQWFSGIQGILGQ